MGTMTATAVRARAPASTMYVAVVDVAAGGTYATGGDTLDLSAIFANNIFLVIGANATVDDAGYKFVYVAGSDTSDGTVQVYWQNEVAASVLVEVTNATDITAVTAQRFIVFGD